jgi:hypothetical protein
MMDYEMEKNYINADFFELERVLNKIKDYNNNKND